MKKSVHPTEYHSDLPLFSRRLKAARLLAELSQEKLGIAAGVDEFSASARINQYERGKHTPDVLTATHLAYVLNVPLSYFYAESEDEATLLLCYYRLPARKRQQMLRLATELMNG
jgi:transcriptional regulator with XRE-family HTH domain